MTWFLYILSICGFVVLVGFWTRSRMLRNGCISRGQPRKILAVPSTQCLIGLQSGHHCFHPRLELYLGADIVVSNKYLGKRWNISDSYLRSNWSAERGTRMQFKAQLPLFPASAEALALWAPVPLGEKQDGWSIPIPFSHVWSEWGHWSRSTMLS